MTSVCGAALIGGSSDRRWIFTKVAQHLDGAITPRRAEDRSARPGARAAEIEAVDRSPIVAIARDGSVAEHLIRQNLAVEDVAAGDADDALDVGRSEHLEMLDCVWDVRREHGERVDDVRPDLVPSLVPRALRQIVRRVLHEETHGVFAGRGETVLRRGLDVTIHERAAAGMAALTVVPGSLEVLH